MYIQNYSNNAFINKHSFIIYKDFSNFSFLEKAKLILQLCYILENGFMIGEEKQLYLCLDKLSSDNNIEIRKLLSNRLQFSSYLFQDIVTKLASDLDEIAIPIIINSPNISNSTLINILKFNRGIKSESILKRNNINSEICFQIFLYNSTDMLLRLIQNYSSNISYDLYKSILNTYHSNYLILNALVLRPDLSHDILYQLILEIDTHARKNIVKYFNLYVEKEQSSFNQSNMFIFKDISLTVEEKTLREKVDQLYFRGILNDSIIIYFLCKGNIYSFLYCISKVSDISFGKVKSIILNNIQDFQFDYLYDKTGLPIIFKKCIRSILSSLKDTYENINQIDIYQYKALIKDYIYINKIDLSDEGTSYIIKLILSS